MDDSTERELQDLAGLSPGPDVLSSVAEVDLGLLGAHDLVDVIAALERVKAHVDAVQARAIAGLASRAEYARCDPLPDGEPVHHHRPADVAADEVSLALRWTPNRARTQVGLAIELVEVLPDTLAALEAGRIDAYKARLIADRTRCLESVAARRLVEASVLASAERVTAAKLDRKLRAAVIAADPAGAEERRADAAGDRRVYQPRPAADGGDNGMAYLGVVGPAEDLVALYTALDAAARHARAGGDARSLDQLRFDLLAGLGWTALDLGHLGCCNPGCVAGHAHRLGSGHGRAAQVNVTVALSTLLGFDQQPGYLEGFGPITPATVRRICGEAMLRRMVTDPVDGTLLDYGRTTYAVPQDLIDFVIARDVTCRFPTCHRSARSGDLDHRHPWHDGGHTSAANLWSLDEGHHLGKTVHGFTIRTDPDTGAHLWVTPAGHTYPAEPEIIGLIEPLESDPPPSSDPNDDPPPF